MQEINRDKLIRELRGNCMCLTYTDNCSKCAEKYPELCKKERKLFKAAADMLEADVAKDMNVPSKWISVKDRLPEHGDVVLCWHKAKDYPIVLQFDKRSGFWLDDQWDYGMGLITHWMPLPEAPKEEQHGS